MNLAPERLIGIDEFASRLGICRRQVYRLVAEGEIPPQIKKRRSIWWPESELLAYIEKLKRSRVPGGKKE